MSLANESVLLEESLEDLAGTIDRLCSDCKLYDKMQNLSEKKAGIWGEKH